MQFEARHFDPVKAGGTKLENGEVSFRAGESPVDLYLYRPKTILAVNVALSTKRPLLISGEPGSGKSTLARNVAEVLGWWYYKQTITSRTQASDLLWTFDALSRLNDANTPGRPLLENRYYIEPGKLWWAFDSQSAERRGSEGEIEAERRARDPGLKPKRDPAQNAAVVLLDEIDKADPDVPNDMLEPLDLLAFTVRETSYQVTAMRNVLMILTTNGERELPPAVLRRCVTLTLDSPTEDWFSRIADGKFGKVQDGLHTDVAREIVKLRAKADHKGLRQPSTAEYLDSLQACRDLGITPSSKVWSDVVQTVLWKHEQPPEDEPPANAAAT
jgi:MoxR-like ATPase